MTESESPPTAEQALALEIIDALSVIAPRGWNRIELRMARGSHGRMRVADMQSQLATESPAPRPQLGLEPGSLHGVVNEALHDLFESLGRAASPPTTVTVARQGLLAFSIVLEGDDSHEARTIEVPESLSDLLIFTEPLFDALLAVEQEFEPQQRALSREIDGHDDWEYDAATQTLQLKRGVLPWRRLHAVPIGSFAHDSESWLWAWANRALPDSAREAAASVRDAARGARGLSALHRPDLPCTEPFAVRIAAVAAMRMNALGIYGAPYGPGVMLLAVMGQ